MASLGELIVRIGADVRNLVGGLNDSTRQLNRWARQTERSIGPVMDGIGRGMMIIGTAAAAGFSAAAAGSVAGASALEQYRNTLNVVMKDQEKAAQTMAWAVDFANKTPFETASVVDATVKLESYGLTAQKVLPAVGDMAAVMNKDIIQAVEAMADAQSGELERLKEFGITKAMIVEHGNKIMRDVEVVNNKGQITDQENFNKALLSLMEERFKGGMEIQATSLKGLWSTVTGVMKTTLATMAGISATGEVVAGGLFDTLKTKLQGVVDTLNKWQKDGTLQEWADNATSAVSSFWNVAGPVFDGLIAAGKWIIDHWGLISPVLAGVLASFLAYKAAIFYTQALTAAQSMLNLVMQGNPYAKVILLVAALVTAGVALYQNWDTIKAKALELWSSLTQTFEDIKQSIVQKVTEFYQIGVGIVQGLWDGIKSKWDWLKSSVSGFITDAIPGVVRDVLGMHSPSKVMAELGVNTVEGLSRGMLERRENLIATMEAISKTVTDSVADLPAKMDAIGKDAGTKFMEAMAAKVSELGGQMLGSISQLSADIRERIMNSAGVAMSARQDAASSLGKAIPGTTAWEAEMAGINRIAAGEASAKQFEEQGLVRGKDFIVVGDKPYSMVPQFDTGGIIPGPLGAPRLVLAHGGETVLPTHKQGYTDNRPINIYLDSKLIGQYIWDAATGQLRQAARAMGG